MTSTDNTTAEIDARRASFRERQELWTRARGAMHLEIPGLENAGDSIAVGPATLQRFEITEEESKWASLRAMISGGGRYGRGMIEAGLYTRLIVDGTLWMSDSPDEQRDHHPALHRAIDTKAESVLVTGLGLGMVLRALAEIPSVRSVDVVETNESVIDLVARHETIGLHRYFDERGKTLTVWSGDARDPKSLFPRGRQWDVAWHDIWPTIDEENYDEMKSMRRKYARRAGWQGVWSGDIVKHMATGRY